MFGCLTLICCLLILQPASAAFRDGSTVYATVGETVSFPCLQPTTPSRPIIKLQGLWTWEPANGPSSVILSFQFSNNPYKGKAPMSERSRMDADINHGNYALSVMQLAKTDEGTFRCSFRINREDARSSFTLRLLQVVSSAGSPVLSNQRVSLSLSVEVGTLHWRGPEGAEHRGSPMELRPPLKPGRQTWVCKVDHAGATLEARYSFEVIGFTHHLPDKLYLHSHQAVTLPCVLSSLPRDLTSIGDSGWFRDGSPFRRLNVSQASGQGQAVDLSLCLRAEEVASGGSFECRLSLGSQKISSSVVVCVINVTSDHSGSVEENGKTSLTCTVSPSCPVTRLAWVRGDGSKGNGSESSGTHWVTRVLERVNVSQKGRWLCQLYNKETVLENVTFWMNVTVLPQALSIEKLLIMGGLSVGSLLMLVLLLVMIVCLLKRSRRRRRAVRRLRHPLCREHGNQLSNQPLCQGNDYMDANRPLPPPPYRRCPHNPPRKGRSSRGNSKRSASHAVYVS